MLVLIFNVLYYKLELSSKTLDFLSFFNVHMHTEIHKCVQLFTLSYPGLYVYGRVK